MGHSVRVNDEAAIEDILRFWFGDLRESEDVDRSKMKLWWGGSAAFDAEIESRFGPYVKQALEGKLTSFADSARGSLALVILLDQFTRNIGRGTAAAFAGDHEALGVCERAIDRGFDRELRVIERAFLYMPMMHAEDRDVARRSVETFQRLSKEAAALGPDYPDFASHALAHAEIIFRFGRFPHRNEAFHRTPLPEETEFLASGGPSFGQNKN
jgi:uncharacterized protein (DUF924 family)